MKKIYAVNPLTRLSAAVRNYQAYEGNERLAAARNLHAEIAKKEIENVEKLLVELRNEFGIGNAENVVRWPNGVMAETAQAAGGTLTIRKAA